MINFILGLLLGITIGIIVCTIALMNRMAGEKEYYLKRHEFYQQYIRELGGNPYKKVKTVKGNISAANGKTLNHRKLKW